MSGSAITLNGRSVLLARPVGGIRGAMLALGVFLGLTSFTPAAVLAAEGSAITGPASVMNVTAELRRHHIRENRLDVSRSGSDLDRYLRDHREREYGN